MANLKTIQEILDDIDTEGQQGNTGILLQDIVFSLAGVGGVMLLNNGVAFTSDGTWTRYDGWTNSRDTKGVQDGLGEVGGPEGWYRLKNNADGDWLIHARIRISVDTNGTYRMRPRKILVDTTDANVQGIDQIDLSAGDTAYLEVKGLEKDMVKNEKMEIQLRGPNGAQITPSYGFFHFYRM